MKLALLSDIHGNLPALETCLGAVRDLGCERILCLGDTFGYFQDGAACFDMLQQAGAEMMLGNHEAMLLRRIPSTPERELVYQLEAERSRLSLEMRAALERLVPFREIVLDGRALLLVHGAPWDPLGGYVFPDTNLAPLGSLSYDFIFMGHTHRPFVRTEARTCVVNVGSCGLPRDIGSSACFAVYDGDTGQVELIRPALDIELVRRTYPHAHPTVLAVLDRR
jgi:predicted phosphodiesterase